jgi:hypothetical protein
MPFDDKGARDKRQRMIEEAAYFRAEGRGFKGGDPVRDWCEAEAEIDERSKQVDHAQCAARIAEALETAGKKLASVRRKAASLSTEARAEWQKDIDKLAALRDALRPRLTELEQQGERAGLMLREQAERIRDEMADLVRRFEAKTKH